jgi:hypothetical protein
MQEEIRVELEDPEIALFCNICHLLLEEWDSFNPATGSFEIPEDREEEGTAQPPSKKK